ncbi:ammonium transporter AmtB-like domain-containing protein, partial [Blyttiomyces helicus]
VGFLTWGAALVFVMTPGLGLFYSGMSGAKNALSLIMVCMLAFAVVTVQWVLFGFSLAFSESGGAFIGDFAHGGLEGVGAQGLLLTAPQVPSVLYAMYQLMFATITPALIFGSVAERIRLVPAMLFVFLWATVVYDPVAYWTWAARGWIHNISCLDTISSAAPCNIGGYDFAGGGPVHIASGFAGLAYCIKLGKRRHLVHKAHNMSNVFLGTALLWFGWFGFNGGSAVAATPRAAMAAFVTTIAAACGALSWAMWDYVHTGKISGLGYCSGAVAGLVAITPASGYVAPWASIIIGVLAGVVCNLSCNIKNLFGLDDTLDAWGVHGIGGLLGNILTGIFAQKWIGQLDGTVLDGGWIEGNWRQVGYQLAGSIAIASWSFVVSYILLTGIDALPGLHIRPSSEEEDLGGDLGEMGEVAYELVPQAPALAQVDGGTTMKSLLE